MTHRTAAVRAIIREVARVTGISVARLASGRATAPQRHVAIYVARQRLGLGFAELGREFGHADHTTAVYAVRRIEAGASHGDIQRWLRALNVEPSPAPSALHRRCVRRSTLFGLAGACSPGCDVHHNHQFARSARSGGKAAARVGSGTLATSPPSGVTAGATRP